MNRFNVRISFLAAALVLSVVVAPAGASGADGPRAQAAKKCKSVKTRDGGRAAFVRTEGSGVTCRRARRVAARADGSTYRALGFSCEPSGKPTRFGLLYGCGAAVNGRGLGIGFFYKSG